MENNKIKVNLSCAMGNPRDHKTWSGTPSNFMREFQRTGYLGQVFESNFNNLFWQFLNKTLCFYYRKIKYRKMRGVLEWPLGWSLLRYLKAYACFYHTYKSKSRYTLHFGTLDLPFIIKPKCQKHYLFTDGSWNLWSQYSGDHDRFSQSIISKINKLERHSYQNMTHIFTTSEYVKQDLINFYKIDPSKLTAVGTGSGFIQPYFGKKDYNNRKILFVAKGRFKDKGGNIVIEAFKKLYEKDNRFHLSIVGQPDDFAKDNNHITTYSFLPTNDLQEMFNTHSLFVMPAINEPWGLVYIEAMLCKMPIVGLNRNSFPELSGYGKRGVGVDMADPQALMQVINGLFLDIARMESMGEEAQRFAICNFSWEQTVNKVVQKILTK